jgi:hypothetical protein
MLKQDIECLVMYLSIPFVFAVGLHSGRGVGRLIEQKICPEKQEPSETKKA